MLSSRNVMKQKKICAYVINKNPDWIRFLHRRMWNFVRALS